MGSGQFLMRRKHGQTAVRRGRGQQGMTLDVGEAKWNEAKLKQNEESGAPISRRTDLGWAMQQGKAEEATCMLVTSSCGIRKEGIGRQGAGGANWASLHGSHLGPCWAKIWA